MGLNFNGDLRGGLGESTVERAMDRGFGLWKVGRRIVGILREPLWFNFYVHRIQQVDSGGPELIAY